MHAPLEAFQKFLLTGETETKTGKYKNQRLFGEMLGHINEKYNLRSLELDNGPLTFQVITLSADYIHKELAVTDSASDKPLQL